MKLKLGTYYLIRANEDFLLTLCYKEPKTDNLLVEDVECLNYGKYELSRGFDLQRFLDVGNFHVDVLDKFDSYNDYLASPKREEIVAKATENVQVRGSLNGFDPRLTDYYGHDGIDGGEGKVELVMKFELVYRDEVLATYEGEYYALPYKNRWDFTQSELDKRWYEYREVGEELKREVSEKFIPKGEDYLDGLSDLGERLLMDVFMAMCDRQDVGYWK